MKEELLEKNASIQRLQYKVDELDKLELEGDVTSSMNDMLDRIYDMSDAEYKMEGYNGQLIVQLNTSHQQLMSSQVW